VIDVAPGEYRFKSLARAVASLLIVMGAMTLACGDAEAAIRCDRLTLDQGERLLVVRGELEPADDPMKTDNFKARDRQKLPVLGLRPSAASYGSAG